MNPSRSDVAGVYSIGCILGFLYQVGVKLSAIKARMNWHKIQQIEHTPYQVLVVIAAKQFVCSNRTRFKQDPL